MCSVSGAMLAALGKHVFVSKDTCLPKAASMAPKQSASRPRQKIPHECSQSGELERRIDVVLDHIEREIVRPAEAPDGDRQQTSVPKRRLFDEEQPAREQPG